MSRAVGAGFEKLAADFLAGRGFTLIETNYTCKGGEIDLVCDHAGTLVFVEVRARRGHAYGSPEETVGEKKRRRIVHAARHYLMMRRIENRACRFDVVAIEGHDITHYENAFGVTRGP
jgi:putative endonuclease